MAARHAGGELRPGGIRGHDARDPLGEEQGQRTAARIRTGALAVLYYVGLGVILGFYWVKASIWARWGLPAAFPVAVLLVVRFTSPPREDPSSRRETAWIACRWDNPLLVKDFRTYTRSHSIRNTVVREAFYLAVLLAVLAYLKIHVDRGTVQDFLDTATGFLLPIAPLLLLAEASFRPFTAWTRERSARTLPLLFLTPLRSEEILRGRLLSGVLYAITSHAPLLILALLALVRVFAHGVGIVGFVILLPILALSPVALLFDFALGCAVRPQNIPPWKWRVEDFLRSPSGLPSLSLSTGCIMSGSCWSGTGPPRGPSVRPCSSSTPASPGRATACASGC